jgi:hypothetical protein
LKYDSLPSLGFKGVVCISYYRSSSSSTAYKIEHHRHLGVGFEPSVNGEITRKSWSVQQKRKKINS